MSTEDSVDSTDFGKYWQDKEFKDWCIKEKKYHGTACTYCLRQEFLKWCKYRAEYYINIK